jgi:hypothetical protein
MRSDCASVCRPFESGAARLVGPPPIDPFSGSELCDPTDLADADAFLASAEPKRAAVMDFPVNGGQTAGDIHCRIVQSARPLR